MTPTLSRKLAQIAIPLVAASVLASCAADLGSGLGAPVPPQDAAETATSAKGLGARPQTAEGQNTVAKKQMAAVTPPDERVGSATPLDAASSLSPFAGMTPEELRAQWGTPSLTRNEAGAQLMQFKGNGCVVLAYLYPSARGGMETAYAEAHPGGDSLGAVTGCLGKSAKQRTAEPAARTRKPELIVKPE
jgi:hypothetical protein